MAEKEELEARIHQLTRRIDEMSVRMSELEGQSKPNGGRERSHRGFLKLGAAAALGGIGMAAGKILPASAATGGNLILGNANLAENPTTIQGDGGTPPVQVLAAEAAGFSASNLAAAGTFAGPLQGLGTATVGPTEGIDGWAQGAQAFAVYGLTDAGTGVVGESNTGIGLHARRSGRIRQDPLAAAGMPGYTPNNFEQVRDANGNLWISQAGGAWRQVAILSLFPNPRRIVDGFATPFSSGTTYGPFNASLKSDGVTPTGVPVGASAAFCAVQSYAAGVLTVFPDATADPGIANYAATTNGTLNLIYMFVPLSAAAKFKIHAYISGNCFVDAWGYVL